ncbi:hypothetical protein DCAR_0933550 [Daucus carota subsp. sativus]|uniref:Uncharacterized protein n=1 Tax=Daucus carota subsp. sativus TaxID=79200 RepID=A0AAF0XWB9_DAUCS|nr:hypothetical protein DCAR_0933550 [Daucus carota subsp. sativus]
MNMAMTDNILVPLIAKHETLEKGAFRESNSGPLAPKARIIPLDQMPICVMLLLSLLTTSVIL